MNAKIPVPPPKRDLVREAIDKAVEDFGGDDGTFNAAGFGAAFRVLAGMKTGLDGNYVDAILSGRRDVAKLHGGSHYRRQSTTSKRVGWPVWSAFFAAVSVSILFCSIELANEHARDELLREIVNELKEIRTAVENSGVCPTGIVEEVPIIRTM